MCFSTPWFHYSDCVDWCFGLAHVIECDVRKDCGTLELSSAIGSFQIKLDDMRQRSVSEMVSGSFYNEVILMFCSS